MLINLQFLLDSGDHRTIEYSLLSFFNYEISLHEDPELISEDDNFTNFLNFINFSVEIHLKKHFFNENFLKKKFQMDKEPEWCLQGYHHNFKLT